jgi:hypothetical protein
MLVPEFIIDVAFAATNVVLLIVATWILARAGAQLKQLSRSTKQLQDAAEKMARLDRNSAGQILRIAREISADIGKLRDIDAGDEGPQFQSLH